MRRLAMAGSYPSAKSREAGLVVDRTDPLLCVDGYANSTRKPFPFDWQGKGAPSPVGKVKHADVVDDAPRSNARWTSRARDGVRRTRERLVSRIGRERVGGIISASNYD